MRKRVLSTILALAVVFSLGVSASATSYRDDWQIDYKTAVEGCTELGIINGYVDGSFRPKGTLTRAEMCTLICRATSDGRGINSGYSPFWDLDTNNWAYPFINYCVEMGIVAGMGDGSFRPNEEVTGTQTAKMVLTAMLGQDQSRYLGSSWAVNINVDAAMLGVYENLAGVDVNQPLSRECAAQMIWNGVQLTSSQEQPGTAAMSDYLGMTMGDLKGLFGWDIEYGGLAWVSWVWMEYSDNRTPFVFWTLAPDSAWEYYGDIDITEVWQPNDYSPVVSVSCSGLRGDYPIIGELRTRMTLAELDRLGIPYTIDMDNLEAGLDFRIDIDPAYTNGVYVSYEWFNTYDEDTGEDIISDPARDPATVAYVGLTEAYPVTC